jgi:hypothetical protein
MFPPNINAPAYGYAQLNPYVVSAPYPAARNTRAGGNTILIAVGAVGVCILIGMALGLGLGIGAAGIITSTQLINVTNATVSPTVTGQGMTVQTPSIYFLFVFSLVFLLSSLR